MTLVSLTLPNDGEDIDASDVNGPFNDIAQAINGNLDNSNIQTGANIDGAKLANATVDTAQLADGSVTNAKLDTTAGELGGAWQSWTPTANWTVDNGTVTAKYTQVGKTVHFRLRFELGSGSSLDSTHTTFSLPVTAHSDYDVSAREAINVIGSWNDDSANDTWVVGGMLSGDRDTLIVRILYDVSNFILMTGDANTNLDSSNPVTPATNDVLTIHGSYEAA